MQDHITVPTCFYSSSDHDHHRQDDPTAVTRPGQRFATSTYLTKIAGRCRLLTVTWCRDLLRHGLSVSVKNPDETTKEEHHGACKVELKPWSFWKRHGSKRLVLGNDGQTVAQVWWDLRAARWVKGETEPASGYYITVVYEDEVVLLLGDLKDQAYKKTGSRMALIDPSLVSRKEHVFGKRKFSTRARFHDKGKLHEICIECKSGGGGDLDGAFDVASGTSNRGVIEPEMEIRLDGQVLVHVKHLQWKFRGNESVHVNKLRVEVFWDVHDWLFSPGLRHALFIFKPVFSTSSSSSSLSLSSSSSSSVSSSGSIEGLSSGGSSEFCLFLYAWKVEA